MNQSAFVILLVLCLTAVALGGKPAADGAKVRTITIKDLKYDPAKITIKVGQTIQWVNKDDHDHTVIAKDKSFESESLGNGETFKHTFKKAGKYEYYCRFHPRMKAVVIVEE
jgi:plastocyanin